MRPDRTPRQPAARPARAWIAPGLLLAGALALGRTFVLAGLARQERGVDPELARWAAASHLPFVAVHALVLSLLAARIAYGARRAALAGALLGTAAGLSVLSGWPTARAVDVAFTPLAGGLALAAGALLALALLALRPGRVAQAAGSAPALAVAALLALLPFSWIARAAARPPLLEEREVLTDLVQHADRLEVVREDPQHPAARGVLSPLVDFRFDTADKPSIVMPPECELALVVAPEEDGARLHAAAGVDLSVRRLVERFGQRVRVRFEVLVDGAAAFDETLEVKGEGELRANGLEDESRWRHAGGAEGIELRAGQRVAFRTSLPDFEGRALPDAARGLAVGFGGMTIERRPTRARTLAAPDRPNVVLIVMDTLRADRMSCYGYPKPTTPHLDRLAADGMLFEEAYAASSWTWPSTASLLTGLMPDEHGVTSNESCTLGLCYETLAEALQARGFSTAAVSCNPLISPERYFDQGFERFDSAPHMRESVEVIDGIVATIEQLADARFFLYLHLADPHTPHRPLQSELARLGGERPADFPDREVQGHELDGLDVYAARLLKGEAMEPDGRSHPELIVPPEHAQWIHDAYDASVGTGDHFCGVVLATLERLGLTDRTVVAFTSDHGEELFDHGLLAHGHTLHRELTRVPLILAGPGIERGARIPWQVSNRQLAPALARIGGARLGAVRDAVDLFGAAPADPTVCYATEKGWWKGHRSGADGQPLKLYGLRADGFVLHRAPVGGDWDEPLEPGGQRALYRNEDDMGEQVDLSGLPAYVERGETMQRELEARLLAWRAALCGAAVGAGASARTALTGLGYTQAEDSDADDEERPR